MSFRAALGFILLVTSNSATAEPGPLMPESGSPLRLLLVEDGDDGPQKFSDGNLIASGVYGLLGSAALSWWANSSKTELYPASAMVDVALAIGVTNAITFALKSSLNRARPYTFSKNYPGSGDKVYSQFQQDDAAHSYPSGHTSNTAAFTYSLATSAAYHLPKMSHRNWLVVGLYAFATASTMLTGEMRVRGGYHFYSDVISGGIIGMSIGIAAPMLHHNFYGEEKPQSTSSGLLSLSQNKEQAILQWSGRF
jgi:membrane-associated phospholipid phosphatase